MGDGVAPGVDQNGLEVLDRDTCMRLLERAGVGRIAVSRRSVPVILPVNFALLGEEILIRTGWSSLLGAALKASVIAFEADDVDPRWHRGWSVSVTGRTRLLRDPDEIAWARLLPLRPWAPGEKELFVAIEPDVVTGRRLPET